MWSCTHLVDEAEDIIICPSGLVEVVGLLQHLRKLLASHVSAQNIFFHKELRNGESNKLPVILGPPLNCGGEKSVPEPEEGILCICLK